MTPPPLERRPILAVPGRATWRGHLTFPRVFTEQQCERIVTLGAALATEQAELSGGGAADGDVADGDVRLADVSWIPPEERFDWIYTKLAAIAERANRTYRFDLTGFTEDLQFTTYDRPGSFYTWHQDGLDGEVAGRKLSLVAQLSPPGSYDGGELEFLDVTDDLTAAERREWSRESRARGTVVAFPAFEYHRVTPLVEGVRHSLVCWIGGPPFR